ncbi:MAG: MarR family transcriptional regulator, partial [Candidatus Dormibacteraeota bacterium]|nr:MarR family transcriptional regulator [Candidatus Dormibacteraeota bacterium]
MDASLVTQARELSQALFRALHQEGDDAWRSCELSLPQLRCLFLLTFHGPMSIGGVARGLGIGLPSASVLVDRLVEHGLVQRREDPMDRRRALASATEAGTALAERLRQGSVQTLNRWLTALDKKELEALVQGLGALVRVAELAGCPAVPAEETSKATVL